MLKFRWFVALFGSLGCTLLGGLTLSGCSGDQQTTGTMVEKSPQAAAGEKASMEHMKSMMRKGGLTKK